MPKVTDKERFTEGDCWLLAKIIEDLTGWPAFAYWEFGEYDHHVWNRLPNGCRLDIEGVCSPVKHNRQWRCKKAKRVIWGLLERQWGVNESDPQFDGSLERALKIAPKLIEEVRCNL